MWMRRISIGTFLLLGLLPATTAAAKVPWEKDLESALRKAGQSQRLVLVHFWDHGCVPCEKVEQKVFRDVEVGRVLSLHFIPVKVNVREHPDLRKKYGIQAWPTDVILDSRGRELYRGIPRPDPRHFLATLSNVAVHARSQRSIPRGDAQSNWDRTSANASTETPQPEAVRNSAFVPPGNMPAANRPPAATPPRGGVPPQVVQNQFTAPPTGTSQRPSTVPQQHLAPPAQPSMAPTAGAYGQQIVDPRTGTPGPPAAASPVSTGQATPQRPSPSPPTAPAGTPQHPPLGLDGYCPVTLVQSERWAKGDVRYGAIHRGRTYLFVDEKAQQAFLADPDRYAPMLSELDVVQLLDHRQYVQGKREHGVFHRGKIYLFANEEDLAKFSQQPDRYHEQAMAILSRAPARPR